MSLYYAELTLVTEELGSIQVSDTSFLLCILHTPG